MSELVLDREQSALVVASGAPMRVFDESGRELGVLTPSVRGDEGPLSITPEEVEELARRAADQRRDWPTTQEVLARLKSKAAS
jgi:hypothetical protein